MSRRRRGNGKREFACFHIGKGTECHRCEMADLLEGKAESGQKHVTNKGYPKAKPKPRTWTKAELIEEVKRLRSARHV